MQKPPPILQQHQHRADDCKKQICLLLGWTDMQHAEYLYQHGISYLYWYLPTDAYGRDQLERSKLYWNWFKYQWMIHDEGLLTFKRSLSECSQEEVFTAYKNLHCPHAMAAEVKPNSVVLSEIKPSQNRNTIPYMATTKNEN